MRRLLLALAAAVALAVTVAACSAPANNPCLYDNGLWYTHLSNDGGGTGGQTLLVVCKDGKIITRHP